MKKQQSSSEKLPPPVVIAGQADAHMTRVFGVRQPQNFFSTKKWSAMCNEFDVLHHNEYGYVVHCPGCSRFQVAFGNLLLSITAEEFERLHSALIAEQENLSPCEEEFRKCVYLSTPVPSLRMVFSPAELTQFCGLIGQAQIMQQVNSWLGTESNGA